MMDFGQELLQEFIEEAKGHIGTLEAGLLRLEEGSYETPLLNELFRAVHSIKGTAGFFEMDKIVTLTHAMETLLGRLRNQDCCITVAMIDGLLTAADQLKELVNNPADQEFIAIEGPLGVLNALNGEAQEELSSMESPQGVWDLWDQLTGDAAQEVAAAQALAPQAEILPVPGNQNTVPASGNSAVKEPYTEAGRAKNGLFEESVRVKVALLDDLLNIIGEMVLRRNQLLRITESIGCEAPQLDVVTHGIDSLTTKLQEKVMKARMQPVANVFNKFPRIVRELARSLGKEVELVTQGMNVEMDRSIIEALVDPMTHLVRNALDHGIELPQVRLDKGKRLPATLLLHAYHESGRVVIDIQDDGTGIDLEKIRTKAVARGWVTETEAALLKESDLLSFIMKPGFSTADQVTAVSGRGVGMDVVKTNIEKLGGKVEVFTTRERGTTFRLLLPLTLVIISSFIVEAAGEAFAIPQANVKELVLLQPGNQRQKRIEFIQTSPVLRLRNRLLPLVRLADILEMDGNNTDSAAYFADETRTFRILVIKSGSLWYGLAVDAVYDTEEILVKPVPAALKTSGCYSGVTVLGDGRIAMILDLEHVHLKAKLRLQDEQLRPTAEETSRPEETGLLLFRTSGGEMLGVDLSMVARVEKVAATALQKIGSQQYITFQGRIIRVIRPEYHLPLGRRKTKRNWVYVILPRFVRFPVGIMAEEIYDVVSTPIQLEGCHISGQSALGSILVNGHIVTLLDMYALFQAAVPEYYQASQQFPAEQAAAVAPRRAKILLAEDTPFFARVTKSYLESDGYEVVVVEDGVQALAALSSQVFDVVVSDVEMPRMDGLELVRTIRAREELKHLPVIALTSLSGATNRERGLRAGFDLYEGKLNRARLLKSVVAVLQKNKQG
ncbi:hybrid sensor histidine kinase/response regulator [Propionispora vibrioides]|uniref:histidine kinase n=1 Tax=Propionispora vibrioides TaxID=112903 RepID=A0A1H8TU15_9FIRM|nr:chemotaxis protein CheW [Propionispora vibrioides]SEO94489.1 two-component system, chemotaxis family, sensor kinase CheA [Propionispora vibrioides]